MKKALKTQSNRLLKSDLYPKASLFEGVTKGQKKALQDQTNAMLQYAKKNGASSEQVKEGMEYFNKFRQLYPDEVRSFGGDPKKAAKSLYKKLGF